MLGVMSIVRGSTAPQIPHVDPVNVCIASSVVIRYPDERKLFEVTTAVEAPGLLATGVRS